jgi:hypothetical protein
MTFVIMTLPDIVVKFTVGRSVMKRMMLAPLLFTVGLLIACSHRTEDMLAAAIKQQDEAKSALAKAEAQVKQLQEENQQLKETPRFFFDQAVSEMKNAESANTDKADRAAVTRFQEVVSRFPEDPLAQAATENISKLNKRISERDLAIQKAQVGVLRLVKTCHDATATVQRISDNDMLTADRFNRLAINTSALLESSRYERAAERAKEKAQALLQGVPDPDKTLAQQVDSCDSRDEQ